MKLLSTLLVVAFATVSFGASAADAPKMVAPAKAEAPVAKKLTPQQEKMKACNKESKEKMLKGPDRKAFMKSCLKGKKEAAAPAAK